MYAVEYSLKQKCLHVDSLERIAQLNARAIMAGREPGYFIVDVADAEESALLIANKWRAALSTRSGMNA